MPNFFCAPLLGVEFIEVKAQVPHAMNEENEWPNLQTRVKTGHWLDFTPSLPN